MLIKKIDLNFSVNFTKGSMCSLTLEATDLMLRQRLNPNTNGNNYFYISVPKRRKNLLISRCCFSEDV